MTAACAGNFRTEVMGHGTAAVALPGVAPRHRVGLALPHGAYDLSYTLDLPRAEVVDYVVECPGVRVGGSVGESPEAYRDRRLAELNRQRAQDRANAASITGALVGAAASQLPAVGAQAGASVTTPSGTATAGAGAAVAVDPNAAGAVAGAAVAGQIDDIHELAPGDLGGRRVGGVVHVATTADGECTLTAVTEDFAVGGTFEVTRRRDLDAEARLQLMAANTVAATTRGTLTAQLVARGADVDARARRIAAAAAAAAELARAQAAIEGHVEGHVEGHGEGHGEGEVTFHGDVEVVRAPDPAVLARAQAAARAAVELAAQRRIAFERERTIWSTARATLIAHLVGWGADPGRRTRLALEADVRGQAEDTARRAALRARYEALTQARAADERSLQGAIAVRAQLRGYLVAHGAHERPAMPPPIVELAGAAPFVGAQWIEGHWMWTGTGWVWVRGGWRDGDRFGATGDSGAVVVGGGAIGGGAVIVGSEPAVIPTGDVTVTAPGVGIVVGGSVDVRDHRAAPPISAPSAGPAPVRDHRAAPPAAPAPSPVRDHRAPAAPGRDRRDHR